MSIWYRQPDLQQMNDHARNTAVSTLGIEITGIGEDYLEGRMPVDHRTIQPFGILHGGASVLLAETLGSIAANHCIAVPGKVAVGLDINANHIRPVPAGKWVLARAKAIHVGATTQVWEIVITTEAGKTVCVSRLTMAVVAKPG